MGKNILVADGGARGHAIALGLSKSPQTPHVYVAPGNAGTDTCATNVAISSEDIPALATFAEEHRIDLTIFSSDNPLDAGAVDEFEDRDLPVWGPRRRPFHLTEGSKVESKKIMQELGIRTARSGSFLDYERAMLQVQTRRLPMVVKRSGLALGKGSRVCFTLDEAIAAVTEFMTGEDRGKVVIEDYLTGPEFSLTAFTRGSRLVCMAPASQDHKTVTADPRSAMTGGTGVVAPLPWVTPAMMSELQKTVVYPYLSHLHAVGANFNGCLYPGLIKTKQGPRVLEYNARPGDPEFPALLRLFGGDLLKLFEHTRNNGSGDEVNARWKPLFVCLVVLMAEGYPGTPRKGMPISGIEAAEEIPGVLVYHAGTKRDGQQVIVNGGRVLAVSATTPTLEEAISLAYLAVGHISFDGMHYRQDIGQQTLQLMQARG